MTCTHCNGTGFLDEDETIICNCCGDGEKWYGEPGNHDPKDFGTGYNMPYAYNGGLPECS